MNQKRPLQASISYIESRDVESTPKRKKKLTSPRSSSGHALSIEALENIISERSRYRFKSSSTSHRSVTGNRPSDFDTRLDMGSVFDRTRMQFETLDFHIAEGLSADNQLRTQEKG